MVTYKLNSVLKDNHIFNCKGLLKYHIRLSLAKFGGKGYTEANPGWILQGHQRSIEPSFSKLFLANVPQFLAIYKKLRSCMDKDQVVE
jgi:hypothetical protein